MKRLALPALLALAALMPATAAAAQSPASQVARSGGGVKLSVTGSFGYQGGRIGLVGDRLRVTGVVSKYVRGQQVAIKITRGSRTLRTTVRTIRRLGRSRGTFQAAIPASQAGRVRVLVVHLATAKQVYMRANARVDLIVPHAGSPATGLRVAFLQQRLAALGYAVPRDGVYEDGTQRAVLAFRKVNGMDRITSADPVIFEKLARRQGGFRPRFPGHGRHVEADISRQVMALINRGGRVYKTYHISSGKPSTPTVLGHYSVYLKTFGVNSKGMVDSNYFHNGYAIHGYPDVPTYNASHGCLRIPVPNAAFVYHWLTYGTPVDVYR